MGFIKEIKEDIDAILDRDPAARNRLEVMACYPGVWAVIWHRPAHWLYKHNCKFLARWLSQTVRHRTGIEIHPGAVIGRRCFIDHGMGVVIGETTEVGDDCTIYQGATLGGTGKENGKRHPTLGNNVMIASGAKILGPFTVGDNSKIGAGAVVIEEVPPNCTVVGVPGKIVKRDNVLIGDMDQISMPDPVANEFRCLWDKIDEMEEVILTEHPLHQLLHNHSSNCADCASNSTAACSNRKTISNSEEEDGGRP